jgi:CRP-like cAMP-binding protein
VTEDVGDLVAAHPLFSGVDFDVAALVGGCSHNVAVATGERLLEEGEPATTLYLLRRGHVALELHEPGHVPLVIERIGPGEALGWSWMFPPYRWHFDARALEPVGAIAIDAECLRNKAESDPVFGYLLMKRLAAVVLDRLQSTRVRLLGAYNRDVP